MHTSPGWFHGIRQLVRFSMNALSPLLFDHCIHKDNTYYENQSYTSNTVCMHYYNYKKILHCSPVIAFENPTESQLSVLLRFKVSLALGSFVDRPLRKLL